MEMILFPRLVLVLLDFTGCREIGTFWLRNGRFLLKLRSWVVWSLRYRFICFCISGSPVSALWANSFSPSLAFSVSSLRFVISYLYSIGLDLLTPFGAVTSLKMNTSLKSYLLTVCAVFVSACIDFLWII